MPRQPAVRCSLSPSIASAAETRKPFSASRARTHANAPAATTAPASRHACSAGDYDGIDLSSITGSGESSNLSWEMVKRIRNITKMKIVLKGISLEDAPSRCERH